MVHLKIHIVQNDLRFVKFPRFLRRYVRINFTSVCFLRSSRLTRGGKQKRKAFLDFNSNFCESISWRVILCRASASSMRCSVSVCRQRSNFQLKRTQFDKVDGEKQEISNDRFASIFRVCETYGSVNSPKLEEIGRSCSMT